MNGLAITIIVGQLPKLFGFSTDADSFVDELREFVSKPRPDEGTLRWSIGVGVLVVLLGLPQLTKRVPAVLVAVVGATAVSAALGLSDEISHRRHAAARVSRRRPLPWTQVCDVGPLLHRRGRHHPRVAHRHDRHLVGVRRTPRRRGRPEPGDGGDRRGERRGRVGAGLRRVDERFADRGCRAVGREEPAHRVSSARRSWQCCCCSSTTCSPTFPSRRSPQW